MIHLKSLRKVFHGAEIKVVDAEQMIIDHCISDDQPDRVNDDIALDGWEIDNFLKNPVVLDVHDYSAPPVGKCLKLYTSGNQLRAETQFAPTERGKLYYDLYSGGFMRAFSVGFIAKEYEPKGESNGGGYHFSKQELLEYSVVPVPCNPRALKRHPLSDLLKIGASISKANRDKISKAMEMIDAAYALLDEVLAEDETDDDETPPGTPNTPPADDAGEDNKFFEGLKEALQEAINQ